MLGVETPTILHSVIGTVGKVTEEILSLEMEGEITRHFSIKDAMRAEISLLQPGGGVLLEFDDRNQIVDLINISGKHQLELIHANLVGVDQNKKVVTLKLKNGTSQSYSMKGAVAGKMIDIKKGTAVTVMVDQHNHSAIDAHVA